MKLKHKNIFETLILIVSHREQFFGSVMIRSAMIADDAEYEAFRHEPTSTLDEASFRISLIVRSKFCCHCVKNAAV